MDRAAIKTAIIIALLIFAGRIAGLLRDLLIASMYGASRTADQLFILQAFPDLLNNFFAGGAIIYVLTPVFSNLHNAKIPAFFWKTSFVALTITGVFALVVGLIFPQYTVDVLAPGFSHEEQEQISSYMFLFALVFPITVLGGLAAARLQGKDLFYAAAAGTLFFNCSLVLGLYFGKSHVFFAFGLAACGGAILRYVMLLISIWMSSKSSRSVVASDHIQTVPKTSKLVFRYIQALLAGGFLILLPYLSRIFLSEQTGAIAIFSYSIKLVDLPLGVAVAILPVVLLPRMARALNIAPSSTSEKAKTNSAQELNRLSIYANLSLSIAIAVPSIYFCRTAVEIVYGWSGLSEKNLDLVVEYARILLVSLPAQGGIAHYISVLHAGQKSGHVTIVTLLTLIVFSIISMVLDYHFGLTGIALALVISYFFCIAILYETTRRSLRWSHINTGASPEVGFMLVVNLLLSALFISATQFWSGGLVLNVVSAMLWGIVSMGVSVKILKYNSA
jgi:putative peptidoglycan lipid II flippase